ncbi:MAG: hypothetical protein IMX01_10055 [Limnochordaceae bacterium]|nr:hypothetical protein [Limnochordaceae bacterium]
MAERMAGVQKGAQKGPLTDDLKGAGKGVQKGVHYGLRELGEPYPRLSWPQAVEQAWAMVEGLSAAELAGQVLAIGFVPAQVTPEVEATLRQIRPGAIILFSRNIPSPAAVTALDRDLQQLADEISPHRLPFLIGTDQEGGTVARLGPPATVFPGNMALGALGDVRAVRQAAVITAQQLRTVGITWNYAPVLDVNNNPANPVIGVRSYGEDPELVAALGIAAIRGYQMMGVMATGKHFPGHGDTAVDSHLGLASVPHSWERLQAVELVPFRRAIQAGLDCIMTAHVHFPAVEPEAGLPATLSARVLTGLLRQTMGFPGLIVPDSMEMKAIADNFGLNQAGWRAIAAGADVAMVSHRVEDQCNVYQGIIEAVQRGDLPRERLVAAAARSVAARLRYGLTSASQEASRLTAVLSQAEQQGWEAVGVGRAQDRQKALTMAAAAITWVRPFSTGLQQVSSDRMVLPLPSPDRPWLVVEFGVRATSFAEDPMEGEGPLARALRAELPVDTRAVHGLTLLLGGGAGDAMTQATLATLLDALRHGRYGALCVATHEAHRLAGQMEMVNQLYIACRQAVPPVPAVVVGMRTPYEVAVLPEAWPYLCLYGPTEVTLAAAAQVLLGRAQARGELPVSVQGLPDEAGRARSWRERVQGVDWVAGLDAGGTSTKCWVASVDGRLLGRGEAGPGNFQVVGLEAATRAFDEALRQALQRARERAAGANAEKLAADPRWVCLGLAGADRPEDRRLLARGVAQLGWDAPIVWENDASIALAAGRSVGAQAVLIAGTGSIAYGRAAADGSPVRAGGWGYLLGDEGSGYDLGRRALVAVLKAWDGRGPATSLTQAILAQAGEGVEPPGLIPLVYRGAWDRPHIAALSHTVLAEADRGDAVAQEIVRQAARELIELVQAVARRIVPVSPHARDVPHAPAGPHAQASSTATVVRAVAAGGLLASGSPMWKWLRQAEAEQAQGRSSSAETAAPRVELHPLPVEPAVGAVLLALERLGALEGANGERVLARLYGSYREHVS